MSSSTPTLKRHNHRVHPCETEKKQELLNLLLSQNAGKNIIIISCEAIDNCENSSNVTFINDADLLKAPELMAELVISYDLPDKAISYMARIAHSTSHALILLDQEEEKLLYPIETLIGRTIMQEPLNGFGPIIVPKVEVVKREFKPREEKREFKPRNNDSRGEKKFGERPAREEKPRSFKPYDKDKKDERPAFKKPYDKDKKDDKSGFKRPYDKSDKPDFKKPYDKDKKDDKSGFKKPYDKSDKPAFKKPYDKDAKPEFKKPYDRDKKDGKKSTFLGKDENGKAIFSGKSGERNHRHDGSKREFEPVLTGKKINVKAFKKPQNKE